MISMTNNKPGVGVTVKVAALRSYGLEFEPPWVNTRWVDSACHPTEVGKMSTNILETRGTASAAQLHSQQ